MGSEEEAPVAKRGRPKQVAKITHCPPLKDTGEGDDNVTIQRNYEKLQKELAEKNPKKEIVLALARQTFSYRRKYVLSEDNSISATQLLVKFRELGKLCCKWLHVMYAQPYITVIPLVTMHVYIIIMYMCIANNYIII